MTAQEQVTEETQTALKTDSCEQSHAIETEMESFLGCEVRLHLGKPTFTPLKG
jgi:hypothetical protein